jgi:PAS domain S-box-containing protein
LPNLTLSAEDVFRVILREVKDFAMFLLDGRGQIETWNVGAERMFGYSSEEAVGQPFSILFTPDDREHGAPERELETAAAMGRAEDTRWHSRKDGSLLFADGVTTAVRDGSGAVLGFAKIAREITERYRAEQRLAAQLALTDLLRQDQSVEETVRGVMQTICENLGWDLGALWMIEPSKSVIRCVEHWHAAGVADDAAAALCDGPPLPRGQGVPGLVWESGQATWVSDFSDVNRFPRAARAASAGLHAAFGFPIVHHGEISGVLEFFSREQREPDQPLMPVMTLIGSQIGEYIERRRTAQALRESEERYRVVSETAQDAIFTIDEDSRILFTNPAAERLFGYTREEMVGQRLEMIIPERFRESHRRGIERFLKTRQRRIPWTGVELPALHRDGHEFPSEISFGEWTENGKTIFTGFARDITERKRAAEELNRTLELEKQAREEAEAARAQLQRRADEEASFRHLASALTGAVEMTEVLYEITNRATQVTRADGVYVERIVGSSRYVEVVASAGRGTPSRGLRVGFPGSMTDEIIKGGEPVILADMKSFGKTMAPYLADTCANCEVLVTPLVAEEEPLGALVLLNSRASGRVFRDSDVVRARTLGDLTSLALRRVRLMEQEREAKEKAEAAVRVRDETLGIVSHDLRNPLTQIALSADLMANDPAGDQSELVETIRSAARQMDRLIQDLLDVARVEAGRFAVDRKFIPAEDIVREVCDVNRKLAEQKQLRLTCNIEGPLPEICADGDRLRQVFANLVGNALKFTPPRGSITVEARPLAEAVEFRVSDTGPGIPDADLKNAFRPYWQAKKTAHMGAGLGLAIVRGIIEAHGGRVWAENVPNSGAMFTFTVPLG